MEIHGHCQRGIEPRHSAGWLRGVQCHIDVNDDAYSRRAQSNAGNPDSFGPLREMALLKTHGIDMGAVAIDEPNDTMDALHSRKDAYDVGQHSEPGL